MLKKIGYVFMMKKNNQLHKIIQIKIKNLLPGNVFLEYHLKNHIADIYWEKENIIFEIQCSEISLAMVKKRTTFYESLGYTIIWILHEKTFNHNNLSPSQEYLIEKKIVYYCNIDQFGKGIIYLQKKYSISGKVKAKSPKLEVSASAVIHRPFSQRKELSLTKDSKKNLSSWLRSKHTKNILFLFLLKKWRKKIYFYYKYLCLKITL